MNPAAVMVAGMSLATLDVSAVEAVAQRVRAAAQLLGDGVVAVGHCVAPGWSGSGHDAALAVVNELRSRLGGFAGALETIAVVLTAFAASLRSAQAEVEAAGRVLESAGPHAAAEPVAAQLRLAELAFDDADRRTASVIGSTLIVRLGPVGAPLPPGGSLNPYRSSIVAAQNLARDVEVAPPMPAAPAAISVWWAGLSASSRRALSSWPLLVAGVDGIPARVRDALNRRALRVALEAAESVSRHSAWARDLTVSVPSALPWPLSSVSRLLLGPKPSPRTAALQQLTRALDRSGSELLVFDMAGDGLAVVASGDVDAAVAVAVVVPGMRTELDDVPKLAREGVGLAAAAGPSTVAVTWLGYDAPSLRQVISDGRAKVGAGPLRRFVAGLRATARLHQHVTVVGHSYGTLVAGIAARRGLETDDLVLLASPGVEAERAAQLNMPPGHVWAARASTDPIHVVFWPSKIAKALGLPGPTLFGPDPAAPAFGASHLDTGGAYGHSGYFTPGSRSLANLGRIVSRPVARR